MKRSTRYWTYPYRATVDLIEGVRLPNLSRATGEDQAMNKVAGGGPSNRTLA